MGKIEEAVWEEAEGWSEPVKGRLCGCPQNPSRQSGPEEGGAIAMPSTKRGSEAARWEQSPGHRGCEEEREKRQDPDGQQMRKCWITDAVWSQNHILGNSPALVP